MNAPDKLPLLKRAFALLTAQLAGRDRVALVVYASAAGVVLPSTVCTNADEILRAIARLESGGSTAGEGGVRLAYEIAREQYQPGCTNRVILATDGDFNVGISDRDELVALIEEQASTGISLTTLGFGTGNLRDDTLEQLADHGDGNYAYVDTIAEARKVLVRELGATLVTVAEDVKLQVSFDPTRVAAHRLVGYENRRLAHRDFEDDSKDAGEIGAGHGVTALFELVPVGAEVPELADLDEDPDADPDAWTGPGLLRVDVRYQEPGGSESRLLAFDADDAGEHFLTTSESFRFASAVAWFGEWLRDEGREPADLDRLAVVASEALGADEDRLRAGFIDLVHRAGKLARTER